LVPRLVGCDASGETHRFEERPKVTALLNWLYVERRSDLPLYKQITDQIRDAILNGDLRAGTALPSTRVLSASLAVARVTVLQAYEVLAADGMIETRKGGRTRVAQGLSGVQLRAKASTKRVPLTPIDREAKHLQKLYKLAEPATVAFQPGIPAFDAFPRGLWSRLLSRQALSKDQHLLDYAHVGGYAPLRQEIATYLRISRGVTCDPEQVTVVTSVRSAIFAASSLLWPKSSRVAVGKPGYMVASRVLKAAGHEVVGVPVDDQGVDIEALIAVEDCAGVYLTPAHHWPTGVALSQERRERLIDWATSSGAWIIEDDYDSEFRFDSPPLAPLHAAGSGRVIYVGTFSKRFAPSVRTAYIVVPRDMVGLFEQHCWLSATEPALHVQAALAELMSQGYFTRHIIRMRKLYEKRRAHLIDRLNSTLGDRVHLITPPGGLQIIALLAEHVPAFEVSQRAAAVELVARCLSTYDFFGVPPNGLQLGFAAVSEDEIDAGVEVLAGIIDHWY
jgi:GntR family transcriptional regulator/MocR family aminotransferase